MPLPVVPYVVRFVPFKSSERTSWPVFEKYSGVYAELNAVDPLPSWVAVGETWEVLPTMACGTPFSVRVPLYEPWNVYTQVTLEPLPLQLSTRELLVKVALIAILLSEDRNVRVEPLMLRVPGGLVTVLPVLVNPP